MKIKIDKNFDALLGGELQARCVTQIYGVPASGKTNIALMATASALKKGKVIYIDCEGGFSLERLKQICREEDLNELLENLMLIEPTEFDEQKVAIKKLDDIIPNSKPNLIIVDSLGALYRLEKDRDIKELGRLLSRLSRISRRHEIPVLITNQAYTNIDTGKIVPVGGDVTVYWSKIIIELEKETLDSKRIAILRKHKFLPEGLRLEFKIVDTGIEVVGSEISSALGISESID